MAAESKDDAIPVVEAKCNTCMACFSSTDKLKDHYRSEWHSYNSKRRAAGVRPVRKKEFKELAEGVDQGSSGGDRNSADVKTRTEKGSRHTGHGSKTTASLSKRQLRSLEKGGKDHTRAVAAMQQLTSRAQRQNEDVEDEEDDDIEVVDTFDEDAVLPVAPHISIFDDQQFSSTAECVQYMSRKYGFFLPDMEYIADLDGLLQYHGEKVKLGGYCLYCQKRMLPGRPVQSHMISKSHCKIRYEEGVDAEEFEDFYDFSSSYEEGGYTVDENGDIVEPEAEVTESGELQLSDGRVLGNRSYRRYYKQHHNRGLG